MRLKSAVYPRNLLNLSVRVSVKLHVIISIVDITQRYVGTSQTEKADHCPDTTLTSCRALLYAQYMEITYVLTDKDEGLPFIPKAELV